MRHVLRVLAGVPLAAVLWAGVTAHAAYAETARRTMTMFEVGAAQLLLAAVVFAGMVIAWALLRAPATTLATAGVSLAVVVAPTVVANTMWWPAWLPGNALQLLAFDGTPLLIGLLLGAGSVRAIGGRRSPADAEAAAAGAAAAHT